MAHLLITQQLAAVPAAILKKPVCSLAAERESVIGALDFAITGI